MEIKTLLHAERARLAGPRRGWIFTLARLAQGLRGITALLGVVLLCSPAWAVDDRVAALEAAASQMRHETMEKMNVLLEEIPEDRAELKPELLYRLGLLYREEERAHYLAQLDSGSPDATGAGVWREKLIVLYRTLLQDHPTFPRAGEVLYELGAALWRAGRQEESFAEFSRLVVAYPESPRLPDAYLALGEYWMARRRPDEALLVLRAASAYPDYDDRDVAWYWLALAQHGVGEHTQAIEGLKDVVAWNTAAGSRGNRRLVADALDGLARCFVDAEDLEGAIAYFDALGRPEFLTATFAAFAASAARHAEHGDFRVAIPMWRKLIAAAPNAPQTPAYQHAVAEAYRRMGQPKRASREFRQLEELYGPWSAWALANPGDPARWAEALITQAAAR